MKFALRNLGVAGLAAIVLLTGCAKKKPIAVAPQAQAPTVTTAAPAPAPQPEAQPPASAQPATATPSAAPAEQQKFATKLKPKHHNHVVKQNSSPPKPAETPTATAKVNVPAQGVPPANNGEQEISVSMDEAQVAHQKQVTEELLQSTDANLKGISRNLNSDELAMVEQVRTYMAQSRTATQDGDLIRAANLAQKAHLLSDALVKH